MSWTWTSVDLRRWRELATWTETAIGEAKARGAPYRGTLRALGRACRQAARATIPSHDPTEIAKYRALLHAAQGLTAAGAVRATATRPGVKISSPRHVLARSSPQLRLPYRDD